MHVLCFCCVFVARIACMCCSLFRICCANIQRLLRMFLLGPICTAFAAHYFISILCAQLFACIAQFLFICCAYCLHALHACSAYTVFCVWRMFCCSYCAHMLSICTFAVPILCVCGPVVVRFVVGPSPLQKRGQGDPFPPETANLSSFCTCYGYVFARSKLGEAI
jgi:hypothetical protein